ncbi:MAG: stage II sporulation protein M [Nanoarchaeota archaeon]
MVLESIISVKKAERKPADMLLLGFVYSSIAILLALWLFPGQASATAVLFTTIAMLPLMLNVILFEEKKEERAEKISFRTHRQAIPFFIFLFLGLLLSFTLWYVILPDSTAGKLFSAQINTISLVNSGASIGTWELTQAILLNNLKVLAVAILLSILYGAGAAFIFAWNASIVAVAIGTVVKHASAASLPIYIQAFARYLAHGIPEITAYFIGGLAGGIISYAIVRHKHKTKGFRKIMLDSLDLIIAAVILLVLAAVIEVFVSANI